MTHAYIEDIGRFDGQEVTVKGWLYNKRSSGKLHFLLVRDGTGVIQCRRRQERRAAEQFGWSTTSHRRVPSCVRGSVRADARAPGGYELSVTDLCVVHTAADVPDHAKEHGIAFLLDHRHLWLRSARQHAILRIRSTVIRACRDYFDGKGFTLLDAPIFTPAACEGTTTLVCDGLLRRASVSDAERAAVRRGRRDGVRKVYCFGPTFRAEKSKNPPAPHRVLDGGARGRLP